MSRGQSPTAPKAESIYFDPWSREVEKEKQRLAKQKEAHEKNPARYLSPTPRYEWEIRRDALAERDAQIRALERALNKAERAIGQKKKVTVNPKQRNTTLDEEILDAFGRLPLQTQEIFERVEASYGEISSTPTVGKRTLIRHLNRLVREGRIEKVGDANETAYRLPRGRR